MLEYTARNVVDMEISFDRRTSTQNISRRDGRPYHLAVGFGMLLRIKFG